MSVTNSNRSNSGFYREAISRRHWTFQKSVVTDLEIVGFFSMTKCLVGAKGDFNPRIMHVKTCVLPANEKGQTRVIKRHLWDIWGKLREAPVYIVCPCRQFCYNVTLIDATWLLCVSGINIGAQSYNKRTCAKWFTNHLRNKPFTELKRRYTLVTSVPPVIDPVWPAEKGMLTAKSEVTAKKGWKHTFFVDLQAWWWALVPLCPPIDISMNAAL